MSNLKNYILKKVDTTTNEVEYFDFEKMLFTEGKPKKVTLAAIDSLTTLFSSGQELVEYTEKRHLPRDEYGYIFTIEREDMKRKKIIEYPIVWDDSTLSAISKVSDGLVDYTNESNFTLLQNIIREVEDCSNGLAIRIVKCKEPGKKLSIDNKKLIGVLASSSMKPEFGTILDAFRSHEQFRALYLCSKD